LATCIEGDGGTKTDKGGGAKKISQRGGGDMSLKTNGMV